MSDTSQSDANIVTRRESVEVITPDGKSLGGGSSNLNSIFDKIEGGIGQEQAIKETMSSKNEPAPAPEAKPAPKAEPEVKPEPKPEPEAKPEPVEEPAKKKEAKSLDDALNNAEEAINPKPEAKPEDNDVAEEDLKVLPQDKPKTAKRIQALLTKITKEAEAHTTTQKERDEQAARVKELESKLAEVKPVDPAAQEEVRLKLEQLAQYRRRYELEKDPEVSAKFDSRITGSEESITTTLKKHGAGEGLLKMINEAGGWSKFADSKTLVPIQGEDAPITQAEFAARVMKALPYSDQRAIDQAVIEATQSKKERERFFAEETKKANEYFTKQEEAQRQQQEVTRKAQEEGGKFVAKFYDDLRKENEWLQEKPIPATATAEQRAQLEDDNKWAKQINSEVVRYNNSKTLPEILAVVADATKYHHERHINSKLTSENASLKATIERMRNAGKVTGKSGSIGGGQPAEVIEKSKRPRSLEEALSNIEETGEAGA